MNVYQNDMNTYTPLPRVGALRSPEQVKLDSEQLPHWLTHKGIDAGNAERKKLYKASLANNGSTESGNDLWRSMS